MISKSISNGIYILFEHRSICLSRVLKILFRKLQKKFKVSSIRQQYFYAFKKKPRVNPERTSNKLLKNVSGEVFLNAFSKAVVLDVYSDFINNFSVAMELAKMESKRKSALADFFKVKQISAHDRLSFFGLMVKPVQRFPQFIMFLQV